MSRRRVQGITCIAHGLTRAGLDQLGVHFDFELDTEDATERELHDLIAHWQNALLPLRATYNHTIFFLSHGEVANLGRLTINAFTPLKNGTVKNIRLAPAERLMMISPYHTQQAAPDIERCPTLTTISAALSLMNVHDLSAEDAVQAAKNIFQPQTNPAA